MPPVLVIGLIVNSALYLAGCFVAGLVFGNGPAWKLALVGFGLAYIGYAMQLTFPETPRLISGSVVGASILAGMLAGLVLL